MGRKTKLGLQLIVAGFFVMMLTTFLMTENYSLLTGSTEVADVESLEDGVYTGTGNGYGGPIEVEVTVEGGAITDVTILEHSESPGIADPAIEGIPSAIVESNSTEVEVVSGATLASNGIMDAVNNALSGKPGEGTATETEPEETEEDAEEIEPSDNVFEDGTYEETVDGHNGPMTVEVVVEEGVITSVEVLEHEETEGLSDPAIEDVPAAIVARNGTDVDTVSGATVSSEAIISAVEKALGMGPKVKGAAFTDGTYEATAEGHNGPVSVEVTVADGAISEVVVTDHEETEGLSDPAIEEIPAAIVETNSTDVDVVSAVSYTSRAIMAAVDEALFDAATAYQVTVDGHNGPLTVVVELADGVISSVEVTEHEETEGLSDPAIEDVPAAIVENNSTDVDSVSGATVSSEAIKEAVDLILEAVN